MENQRIQAKKQKEREQKKKFLKIILLTLALLVS